MAKQKPTPTLLPGRLWPNAPSGSPVEIEVFGATGEYKSGKTLLGLSIAPGPHPEGHEFAGKPRTLYLDYEKSGGTYQGLGCCRIDVPVVMQDHMKGKPYRPLDVFKWFLEMLDHVKPNQFDVIMKDPITDIESGLVEYVKQNCTQFGLTQNQIAKSGGLLWGAVKDYWKQVLLKLSAKCKCFYFTSHLRDVWSGNTPIKGQREPKGKNTLLELSSLYLWLDREPRDGKPTPAKPAANVLKERLADTSFDDAGNVNIVQLMPPRLPIATVDAIRQHIVAPPDYAKLKKGERVIEQGLSDDDKLRMQEHIAEADRDAQESRLALMGRQAEIAAKRKAAAEKAPQEPDQAAKLRQEKAAAKAKADAEEKPVDDAKAAETAAKAETAKLEKQGEALAAKISEATLNSIKHLVGKLEWPSEKWVVILAHFGATKFTELTDEQGQQIQAKAEEAWREMQKSLEATEQASQGPYVPF